MSRIRSLLDDQEEFEEEQRGEVRIAKGKDGDLEFLEETEEYPSFEEYDSKFKPGTKKRTYTLQVVNLRAKSDKVKLFKCSEATFKKIGTAIDDHHTNRLHLINPIEENAGFIVKKSEVE